MSTTAPSNVMGEVHDSAEMRPGYYDTESPYEPWKIIRYWKLNYHEGSALAYILRARRKSRRPQEDYRKAATHLMQLARDVDTDVEQDKFEPLSKGESRCE